MKIAFYLRVLLELCYLIKLSFSIEIVQNTKVLLSSSFSYDVPYQKCVEFLIPNSYKKIFLLLSAQNIDKTILTDARLVKCDESLSSIGLCCANNSSFCMENINPTKYSSNINYCLESSYLYACSINNNFAGTINVEIDVVKGQGCQIAEFSEETECSNIGTTTCRDQNKCHYNCQYVECLRSNMSKIFSMCLPVNYTQAEMMNKCSNHIDFEENEQYMKIEKCLKSSTNIDVKEQSSSHKFFKWLAVIFGVSALGLFMASVYYRFKMSMDVNRPPFNPPWFCPNFIFPRINPSSLL